MAYPEPVRREFFPADDGIRLSLLRSDPSSATAASDPAILLVPGWCMPAAIWQPVLEALAPRHRVAALDPRGQGESAIPDAGYHIDQRADDLRLCIERLAPVVLVGWSLGALEALQCLHRHGDRGIAGLALVDSSVGEEPKPPPAAGFREGLLADRAAAMDRFVRSMFKTQRPEAEIAALIRASMQMPLESSLALFPGHLPREHWRDIARNVRVPLLYAVTAQFAGQAHNLALARPGTRIEVFPDAGHALFVDEAHRFNRMLVDWVESECLQPQAGGPAPQGS